MNITTKKENSSLTIIIEGRIDTATAPALDSRIIDETTGIDTLVLDFNKVEYISSAGLRVLLSAQKLMNKQGKMIIKNVREEVMDVFEITGFIDILTIE